MWLGDAPPAGVDAHTSLLLAVIYLLSAVLVAALGGVASVMVARSNRRENEQGNPVRGVPFHDYVVGELAVARNRLDDHDEALALIERRQEKSERAADPEEPDD